MGLLSTRQKTSNISVGMYPPTDGLALMWHILIKLSSEQSRWTVTKNVNIHDCVKLRGGFSQLSFMYLLFSFNIFLITHFRVVLSFEPPLDRNNIQERKRYAETIDFFLVLTGLSAGTYAPFEVTQNLKLLNILLLTSPRHVFDWRLHLIASYRRISTKSPPHFCLSCRV